MHQLSPILGIAIAKIAGETLNQSTILFKLVRIACNLFPSV
jgi:uncharacterized membrane protein